MLNVAYPFHHQWSLIDFTLCLTPDNFTRQRETLGGERVTMEDEPIKRKGRTSEILKRPVKKYYVLCFVIVA